MCLSGCAFVCFHLCARVFDVCLSFWLFVRSVVSVLFVDVRVCLVVFSCGCVIVCLFVLLFVCFFSGCLVLWLGVRLFDRLCVFCLFARLCVCCVSVCVC